MAFVRTAVTAGRKRVSDTLAALAEAVGPVPKVDLSAALSSSESELSRAKAEIESLKGQLAATAVEKMFWMTKAEAAKAELEALTRAAKAAETTTA